VPTIDQEHYSDNLFAIYDYVRSIPYKYDTEAQSVRDYWQIASETIQLGHGDCEDHAILLETLMEALYRETYGWIPENLAWVVVGEVNAITATGGHAWTIVNEGLLPQGTVEKINNVPIIKDQIEVIVGDIARTLGEISTTISRLDLNALPGKSFFIRINMVYKNGRPIAWRVVPSILLVEDCR
jgi:hypothetical protein